MIQHDSKIQAENGMENDMETGTRCFLSPHYPWKKEGSFLHKYKESHTPKGIKDP